MRFSTMPLFVTCKPFRKPPSGCRMNKRACCPDIPWREISGFRNILVHNYLGDIDPLTIRQVIEAHLPALDRCMRSLLEMPDNEKNT